MRALKSLRGKRLQRAKSLASDCFGARQPTDRLWPIAPIRERSAKRLLKSSMAAHWQLMRTGTSGHELSFAASVPQPLERQFRIKQWTFVDR
jgi:hypothetical protein